MFISPEPRVNLRWLSSHEPRESSLRLRRLLSKPDIFLDESQHAGPHTNEMMTVSCIQFYTIFFFVNPPPHDVARNVLRHIIIIIRAKHWRYPQRLQNQRCRLLCAVNGRTQSVISQSDLWSATPSPTSGRQKLNWILEYVCVYPLASMTDPRRSTGKTKMHLHRERWSSSCVFCCCSFSKPNFK